jgi:hypothetical protein
MYIHYKSFYIAKTAIACICRIRYLTYEGLLKANQYIEWVKQTPFTVQLEIAVHEIINGANGNRCQKTVKWCNKLSMKIVIDGAISCP